MASSASNSASLIRQKYRSLARLLKRLPVLSSSSSSSDEKWQQLRCAFREPLKEEHMMLEQRLKLADDRLTFLKMITPKTPATTTTHGKGGKWIYKNGQRLENVNGTVRDAYGKVVSNWDGKNLDPESVKRHNHHLKRLGFRNNAHAKGIF